MKIARITSVILAGSAAAVTGLALTAGPASARTVTAHKPKAVVLDCLSKPRIGPRDFVLTCADGNVALTRLSWTSWTPKLASATGTLAENDCVPYCAAGHFHDYPVLVVLWRPVRYLHTQRFSEITMIFPGARPRVFNGHNWVPGPVTITSALWGPAKA